MIEPEAAGEQERYEVRFDWGRAGLEAIGAGTGVIVLVDVLSFSTTVDLAVAHGLEVVPHGPGGDLAADAAASGAVVAGPRGAAGITLAPSSITGEAVERLGTRRVLIASPNGSRIAADAVGMGVPVLAGSLRNRAAVARWVLARQEDRGDRLRVAVIAAGETRDNGTVRFAVEDLLAAGAIVDALADVGIDYCSPEAAAASAAFCGLQRAVGHLLTASVSGAESSDTAWRADLALAGRVDASDCVPVLVDGIFRRERPRQESDDHARCSTGQEVHP